MTLVLIPCSRSAHDQNVLARRPQWDQHGCHSNGEMRASLEGLLGRMRGVRCAQLRATLATPLKGGIGNWKALARDKARLGALRAGWVEYCAQLESSQPPLK
jgi:hypothetical protein